MTKPRYYDIRCQLWKASFEEALPYDDYLARSPEEHVRRWRKMDEAIPALTDEQRRRLSGHHRIVNVLVVSGVWCGDCARQGPMIRHIVDACDEEVSLRLIDRDARPDLRDEVRILGAERVPVAVFLSEDFFEIGRVGDRMLTTYRRKAETEVGATCPVPYIAPSAAELAAEQAEWVDVFERVILMARLSPPLRERHGD